MLALVRLDGSNLDQAYGQAASIKSICQAYDRNEIAADQQYKGRVYILTGELYDVRKTDEGDVTVIRLKVPQGSKIDYVECFLDNPAGVQKLQANQTVNLRGTIDGLHQHYLTINHCVLR